MNVNICSLSVHRLLLITAQSTIILRVAPVQVYRTMTPSSGSDTRARGSVIGVFDTLPVQILSWY